MKENKKYLSGQLIKINNKTYQITEVDGVFRRCRICQEVNGCIPCFNPDPTLGNPNQWTKKDCTELIPENCYLKPICGNQGKQ